MATGGRPRKIKSPAELERYWSDFKEYCDKHVVETHGFSQKRGKYVSNNLTKPLTYTIEGLCVFIGIARRTFYDTYNSDPRFSHIVTRIREECEVDARRKFETEQIPSQLAGLWMARHGYTIKNDTQVSGRVAVASDPYEGLTTEELRALAKAARSDETEN